ncbi:MAG: hypothetical protein HYS38_05455 [Acidobacteria bacterium]|nr:hypothetical protein [Acidobacteriota bacterium]
MRAKPIVQFNASIYKYPYSVSRGYWETCALDEGLAPQDRRSREDWLRHARDKSRTPFHDFISSAFADANDTVLLRTLIIEHGIFAESFFHKIIRQRVLTRFGEVGIDLGKFQKLLSSAIGYEFRIRNAFEAVDQIVRHLYEQATLEVIKAPQAYLILKEWFFANRDTRACGLCGTSFRLIDLPNWVYFGANGFKHCCFTCRLLASPRKAELPDLIRRFTSACGFIPTAAANPINFEFTSRLPPDRWRDAILSYAAMGGIDHVKRKFGSWFAALAQSGSLPDGVQATARGIRCLANDGHICFSLEEKHIDNWLSDHAVPHEREPFYPSHHAFNPTGRRRADWKVRDIFVEYFGLSGDEGYDNKLEEKLLLARELRIDLIAIYPQDISTLDDRLARLIE